MSETDPQKITEAATAVMTALQPLSSDERSRVLQAAAALHGIGIPSTRLPGQSSREEMAGAADEKAPPVQDQRGKRQSIVEFLNDRQPATNAQRIACFAHYREHIEGKGSNFSKGDLEPYFAAAKLPKPGNYDRDFRESVKSGWIHEDGANSYLTQGGEDAVRAGFGGRGKPRGAAVAKKKRGAPEKAS